MELTLDRSLPPSASKIDRFDITQAKKYTLDNGIPVYSINSGFQELVKIEFIFPNTRFSVEHPILNSSTNLLLSEGTSKYNSQQLADHIDYYGAFCETEENADFTSVILFSLNKYLDNTLPYIGELLNDPIFPDKEIVVFAQNSIQKLNVENERTSSVTRKKFNEIIFGNTHPYGYFKVADDYTKLTRDQIQEHHKFKYVPENCTIIISGLVKEDSINSLNKNFGQQKKSFTEVKNGQGQIFSPSTEKKHLIEKSNAVQSGIRIGKPFFNRRHPDYPGAAVLNTILGGFFGSRLMSNIREDKGFTYGIGSAIVSMKQEGYFFISTEVGVEFTSMAVEEIYKEVELLRNESVEYEELEMARNYMMGSFLKGIDGAFHLAERFKSIYFYGLDYTYYDRYIEKVRTIQPDEIKELASKYFDSTGFFELVVGRK